MKLWEITLELIWKIIFIFYFVILKLDGEVFHHYVSYVGEAQPSIEFQYSSFIDVALELANSHQMVLQFSN